MNSTYNSEAYPRRKIAERFESSNKVCGGRTRSIYSGPVVHEKKKDAEMIKREFCLFMHT